MERQVDAMKTLMVRCKQFFGLRPGQSLREFGDEFARLTEDDKQELVELFNEAGMPTVLSKEALPKQSAA